MWYWSLPTITVAVVSAVEEETSTLSEEGERQSDQVLGTLGSLCASTRTCNATAVAVHSLIAVMAIRLHTGERCDEAGTTSTATQGVSTFERVQLIFNALLGCSLAVYRISYTSRITIRERMLMRSLLRQRELEQSTKRVHRVGTRADI